MLKNVTTMYIISVVDFFYSSFKQSIDKLQEKTQSKSPSTKKRRISLLIIDMKYDECPS